jgi:hypothetical protein
LPFIIIELFTKYFESRWIAFEKKCYNIDREKRRLAQGHSIGDVTAMTDARFIIDFMRLVKAEGSFFGKRERRGMNTNIKSHGINSVFWYHYCCSVADRRGQKAATKLLKHGQQIIWIKHY